MSRSDRYDGDADRIRQVTPDSHNKKGPARGSRVGASLDFEYTNRPQRSVSRGTFAGNAGSVKLSGGTARPMTDASRQSADKSRASGADAAASRKTQTGTSLGRETKPVIGATLRTVIASMQASVDEERAYREAAAAKSKAPSGDKASGSVSKKTSTSVSRKTSTSVSRKTSTSVSKNTSTSVPKKTTTSVSKKTMAAAAADAKASSSSAKSKTSAETAKAKTASASKSKTSSKAAAGKGSGGSGKGKGKGERKKKHWFFRLVKGLVLTVLICIVAGTIAGAAYTAYVISQAETIHPDRIYETLEVSTHIYDDQEQLVEEIYFSENRKITTYEQLPDNLKNAFVAVEDKTFWTHKGFNFRRIFGAILEKFKGGSISGTSTITQQLARNVFLPDEKSVRSLKRKITEMYYAYLIEQQLSKEEIITAYLNTIYLGYGCYGVDVAAHKYFSCEVEDLTLEQCAALAALPQAPGSYALIVTEEGENTTELGNGLYANDTSRDRRNLILSLMEEQGYITAEEREAATRPLEEFIEPGSESDAAKSAFKDYLIETVKRDLMREYDLTEEQATKLIYTKGLKIYSTMDSQAQNVITKQFRNKNNFPTTEGDGSVEAAMVITEVGTGEIKAMVGTRNASGQMLFNRATNPRQPGSSIKPLSVYAPALQKSLEYQAEGKTFPFVDTGYDKQGAEGWGDYITVSSLVVDEKMKVNGSVWPHNVTRKYSGDNTFRSAIQKSINTCAVKILAQVGIDYSIEMVEKFGITTLVTDTSQSYNDVNLAALGLGAMTNGVTPLEMSLAYAAFPNGGVVNTPICYTRVEDANGRTLLEAKSKTTRVMDEGVAWIMTDVLRSIVTDGIATGAAVSGVSVGGKTGTTDDRYDIWFDGFTPTYSAALWIGTDDNVRMSSGSGAAAALWSKIMGKIDRAKGGEYPGMPKNVVKGWDGEFYTDGTVPPEPEPEPEEEEEEAEEKADGEADAQETDNKDTDGGN